MIFEVGREYENAVNKMNFKISLTMDFLLCILTVQIQIQLLHKRGKNPLVINLNMTKTPLEFKIVQSYF